MFRMFASLVLALALSVPAVPAAAQSQAINGTIEGTVLDPQGAVLPGVTVTVVNVDTGDQRVVVTNESGLFRAPLLTLGGYRVSAELQGFRKFEQTGVRLSAGTTAVINITLTVGAVAETITVVADSPIVDLAKIEQGRTLTEAEVKTLPLTSRNPYNFALLQPGVVGFETNEFGVPRLTANGALLRVNYQVDGSNNTQKDRAGLRQMPMSEVMIREVKVVTTGYAPEFGQTMGLVYNAITPSGTNRFKGQSSYRMQRKPMVAFPFYTLGPHTSDRKPPTDVNVFTADIGGPIVRDKTHFFGGYEHTERDLSGLSVITISPANQAALGLNEPAYMPRGLNTEFAIGKVDHQFNQANRLSFRYMFFDNFITANVGGVTAGVPNSVLQATDFADRQHSTGAQLISTLGANTLNELRVQYATRAQSRVPNALAGTGPAVRVAGVANIGGPVAAIGGRRLRLHAGRAAGQQQHDAAERQSRVQGGHRCAARERHSHIRGRAALHLPQHRGLPGRPRRYESLRLLELHAVLRPPQPGIQHQPVRGVRPGRLAGLGGPEGALRSALRPVRRARRHSGRSDRHVGGVPGVEEQLRAARRRRVGARRERASPCCASTPASCTTRPSTPSTSRRWPTTGPTPVPRRRLPRRRPARPAFPAVLSAGSGAQPNTAWTVDPDFDVARSWQNNVQFERALSDRYSVSIGASYVRGYNLPLVTNINLINPISTLPDGIPVFAATPINSTTRVDPRYSVINSTQSLGESTYKNMTLQFTRRHMNGIGFDFAYTLGKSEDNAPITSIVVGAG